MTATVLTPVELDGIAGVMSGAGVTLSGALRGRLLTGGRSNLTFRLEDDAHAWVMRTPPRAGRTPSAHDVAREFRAIDALAASDVPVPPAVVLCEDEAVLGGPFAISGFVDGRTIQTRDQLAELTDVQVTATIDALTETLAALHRVDHVAVGLERFGRPDAYAERQLKRWSGQWEIVGTAASDDVVRVAADLITRLAENLPVQAATGIVHGDFRVDNTLVRIAETQTTVAAVVDWELSTIGDPVADVASMCVYRNPTFDLIVGEPAAWTSDRLPSAAELAASYERAGGVALRDFDQHLALAHFKLAVIAAGIDHRYRAGATSGDGFDTAGESVLPLLEAGLACLRSGVS